MLHIHACCKHMFQVFHTYVCKCFIMMLYMFAMVFKCFSGVFASVSDACFKCFIYLLLYVATVVSGCFKSKSDVTHGIRMGSTGGMKKGTSSKQIG